jgi:hypothetical protein
MDQMGNLYQVSGDRADGLGFGHYPTSVSQTDVTLGAAYLKAQGQRTHDQITRMRAQKAQDNRDALMGRLAADRKRSITRREAAMGAIARHPVVMDRLTRQALQMGHCDGCCNGMNGNTLTANGQSGWRGMSRDQQIIHHTLTGMGADVSRRVDPVEANKKNLMRHVETVLRVNSPRLKR